ncbi:unnamed protein product [Pieris macdunnoughi]|uniref:Lipase n=1 Tax=Pieris macdunnoughi TaxID=345717 RepID=A0A821S1Q0_9NEOP|nr:unnamed protein product [Pieris macdunnoughi]
MTLIKQVQLFKIPFIGDIFGGTNFDTSNTTDDAFLNISQLVQKYAFQFEEHTVTTEDGYILALHRLQSTKKNGIPVLLMHGILDSADCWVLQGPNNSLGYILANEGFDVWMGNARGNQYSLSHVNLTSNDRMFWNFTWEEIGLYDLPAFIDYILNKTDSQALYYVGHSQGTTSFYVMNALRPEYNKKIKLMFSLSPIAWMKNIENSILKFISKFVSYSPAFNVFTPSKEFFVKVSKFCTLFFNNCDNLMNLFSGSENSLVDKSMLPVIYGHYPSTSSTLQFIHYGQLINSGRFCRFDFGDKNILKYGDILPPNYDLSNVVVPIVLFYSNNDWLSNLLDVETLSEHLPLSEKYFVENFNHIDYLYAKIAKDKVYWNILKHIFELEKSYL